MALRPTFILGRNDFLNGHWFGVLSHLSDFRHCAPRVFPAPRLIRYESRDRLSVARDQNGLAPLDVVEKLKQLSLGGGSLNSLHRLPIYPATSHFDQSF
jgi:hypothetical protein